MATDTVRSGHSIGGKRTESAGNFRDAHKRLVSLRGEAILVGRHSGPIEGTKTPAKLVRGMNLPDKDSNLEPSG